MSSTSRIKPFSSYCICVQARILLLVCALGVKEKGFDREETGKCEYGISIKQEKENV